MSAPRIEKRDPSLDTIYIHDPYRPDCEPDDAVRKVIDRTGGHYLEIRGRRVAAVSPSYIPTTGTNAMIVIHYEDGGNKSFNISCEEELHWLIEATRPGGNLG